ncbi:MAG: hypothetical protein AAF310_03620 [Myxococcota bacterium]
MKTICKNLACITVLSLFAGCSDDVNSNTSQLATAADAAQRSKTTLSYTEAKQLIEQNCDAGTEVSLDSGQEYHDDQHSDFFFKHALANDNSIDFIMHTCPVSGIGKFEIQLPDGSRVVASDPDKDNLFHPVKVELDTYPQEHLLVCSKYRQSSQTFWPLLFHADGRVIRLDDAGMNDKQLPCWHLKGKEIKPQTANGSAMLRQRAINVSEKTKVAITIITTALPFFFI